MNIEDRAFEKHCSDLYFFCPLCEDYHKKMFNKSTKSWGLHSLCQAPIEVQEYFEK